MSSKKGVDINLESDHHLIWVYLRLVSLLQVLAGEQSRLAVEKLSYSQATQTKSPSILISTEPQSKMPLSLVQMKLLVASQKAVTKPYNCGNWSRIDDHKKLIALFLVASESERDVLELHYRQEVEEVQSNVWHDKSNFTIPLVRRVKAAPNTNYLASVNGRLLTYHDSESYSIWRSSTI